MTKYRFINATKRQRLYLVKLVDSACCEVPIGDEKGEDLESRFTMCEHWLDKSVKYLNKLKK